MGLELAVAWLHRYGPAWNVGLHLAFLLLFPGLLLGLQRMAREALAGRPPRPRSYVASLREGPGYLLATLLYLAVVGVGLVLLVAPGLYVAVRYSLFGPVLAGRPESARRALSEAAELARGRWWRIARVQAEALGLNLLGAAFLGVGLLVTFPLTVLAVLAFHQALDEPPGRYNPGH